MRQIGGSNFGARQMIDILEVQVVAAIIEHVNHFMCENRWHTVSIRIVLAHNNLVHFGIEAAVH